MEQYISKSDLVAEIEKRIKEREEEEKKGWAYSRVKIVECEHILSFINTLEVKEVDLELLIGWFDHIAQIADDRMTLTGQRMTDAHALDEIKCLAKNSSEFIQRHYKA